MPIRITICVVLLFVFTNCSESKYTKLVDSEMNKNIIYDSLFFGLKFGHTKKEFFDICWQLNKRGLISQGPDNKYVQYPMPKNESDSLRKNITQYFYGIFNDNNIMTGIDLKFSYDAWSLWNKSYQTKVLLPSIKDSLQKWFPGNGFISIELKKSKKEVFVKIDGNRRILIEPLDSTNTKELHARIDDLRYQID